MEARCDDEARYSDDHIHFKSLSQNSISISLSLLTFAASSAVSWIPSGCLLFLFFSIYLVVCQRAGPPHQQIQPKINLYCRGHQFRQLGPINARPAWSNRQWRPPSVDKFDLGIIIDALAGKGDRGMTVRHDLWGIGQSGLKGFKIKPPRPHQDAEDRNGQGQQEGPEKLMLVRHCSGRARENWSCFEGYRLLFISFGSATMVYFPSGSRLESWFAL